MPPGLLCFHLAPLEFFPLLSFGLLAACFFQQGLFFLCFLHLLFGQLGFAAQVE